MEMNVIMMRELIWPMRSSKEPSNPPDIAVTKLDGTPVTEVRWCRYSRSSSVIPLPPPQSAEPTARSAYAPSAEADG